MDPKSTAETVVKHLEDAWNAADGAAFAEPFAPDADFVNIRGDYHSGREAIAAGHQMIFETTTRAARCATCWIARARSTTASSSPTSAPP
jgi:uncharacterized protein (TIGR02246 family)